MRVWRFAYDGLGDEVSLLSGIDFLGDPGLTVQSARDDADINVILRRFGKGAPVVGSARPPQFGDFTGPADYQSALEFVRDAQGQFSRLPAVVRARFANDPHQLMAFLSDPANRLEAAELGLLEKDAGELVKREAAEAARAVKAAEYDAETARRAAVSAKAPLVT